MRLDIPTSEELNNCILETNYQHRWIKVHHNGKTILWVKEIPLLFLKKPMIEILSDNRLLDTRPELEQAKRIKKGQG